MIDPEAQFVLPCIVCGKVLESGAPGAVNQPSEGTAFYTHGHYGSTTFDPMLEPLDLEITVCDPCLRKATDNKQVLLCKNVYSSNIQPQYVLAEVNEHGSIGCNEIK